QSFRLQQSRDEKQCDHRDAGAQVGQGELRQQRDRAPASLAKVAAHPDQAVEGGVDERARVEAMSGERVFGLALRTVGGAMAIRIGGLFEVLLHRTGEWM